MSLAKVKAAVKKVEKKAEKAEKVRVTPNIS